MIEAMAAGTPIIAGSCGSVPVVIEDGLTGFVVSSEMEAVDAIGRVHRLDPGPYPKKGSSRNSVRAIWQKNTLAAISGCSASAETRAIAIPESVRAPSEKSYRFCWQPADAHRDGDHAACER